MRVGIEEGRHPHMMSMVPGQSRMLCLSLIAMPEDEHVSTSSTSSSTVNHTAASSSSSSSWLQLGLPFHQDASLMLDLNLGGTPSPTTTSTTTTTFHPRPPPPPPSASCLPLPIFPSSFSNHPHLSSCGLYNHPAITSNPFLPTPPPPPYSPSFNQDFKFIHLPPSDIWFMLQASLHQSTQPFLPQLSKCFLRIRDGSMTVRLVMKYLANKLGLESESQVEIRCREQVLEPFLTLQHVRDQIWSQSEAIILLPNSSTSPHLMLLHYGSTSTSST